MQEKITAQLLETLQKKFGFQTFRPGQLEAIITLMMDGRLLCIQPTGHGKSLLYQLPAILLDGLTLVISPLLALMRDQLQQLETRFGIAAASINTDQTDEENAAARRAAQTGAIRILFIAPEQLDHIDRFNFLLRLPIQLLVVDEAHCISTWGHDFRPSYRQIIQLVHALTSNNPTVKLLALTATANTKTEQDIKQQLTIDAQKIVVHRESMDRPNIRLTVLHTSGMAKKLITLENILKKLDGSGLIYCATRENTELVAQYLSERSLKTTAYHAGFDTQKKCKIQHDFIHDKCARIVATNALGMGIDKPNLRYIIHFDFPGSITAYYQEVGRCGRDGLPADGIMLYDSSDSKIQKHFIDSAQPDPIDFQRVLNVIKSADSPPNLALLKREIGLHPTRLTVVVAELIEQQFIRKISQAGLQVYQPTQQSAALDLGRYATQLTIRNVELAAIQYYAEQSHKCLMCVLREALGDIDTNSCKQCGVCTQKTFGPTINEDITDTLSWLNKRALPITLNKKIKATLPGAAVLDGRLRSHEFIHFMRGRGNSGGNSDSTELGISAELLELIRLCVQDLTKEHSLTCIVPLPSKTWKARDTVAELLAKDFNIPVFLDVLYWQTQPAARQGELLNNDQRQHNVAHGMRVKNGIKKMPPGAILLLDDYTGSGATLNEAARALRQSFSMQYKIVPFTIAMVKWHLGQRGMV